MSIHRLLGLMLGLALMGRSAPAADYQILRGRVSDPDGTSEALAGHFAASPGISLASITNQRTLLVEDFAFQAGDRSFTHAGPASFEGIEAIVQIGDVIGLAGNEVRYALLRSGGEMIRADSLQVTLRYLDFRSSLHDGGSAVGVLRESRLPRRLHLAGDLVEVEQSFEIQDVCVRLDDPIIGLEPVPSQSGDVTLVAVGGVGDAPRQDEPRGSVSIRDDVGGRSIPADVGFRIVIVQPPPDPIPLPFCSILWPIVPPVEHAVGRFDLVATGARPIEIDVQPARTDPFVAPGSAERIPVAILGDPHLDVRDIDETSLRLGDAEAAPLPWPGREVAQRRDVDRDGDLDLVARFAAHDTGVAYGDDLICLVAQTFRGQTLEGCDAIRTLPGH